MPKKPSHLWRFFTLVDKSLKTASCDICGHLLSYKTTITNLKKHMKSKHPTVNVQQHKGSPTESRQMPPVIVQGFSVDIPVCSQSAEPEQNHSVQEIFPPTSLATIEKTSQTSVTSYFQQPKKLSEQKKEKLDILLLELFWKDFQPFSLVEDKGFKKFIKELNPYYEIPNRKVISNTLIPAQYVECLNAVNVVLKDIESATLTIDTWTSRNVKSYLAITVHFIVNFKLQSILLSCEKLPEAPHTSQNLTKVIKSVINRFNLSRKVLVVITDNAANIVGAVQNCLLWKHFPCFAHTLNLVLHDGIKSQMNLVDKVKRIVGHFKKSTTSAEKLMNTQRNKGIDNPKKLIQSVETRWYSIYFMLERFIHLEEYIKMTLAIMNNDSIEQLSLEEWQRCRDLLIILKPFEEILTRMGAENHITGSEIIVFVRGLNSVLDRLKNKLFSEQMAEVLSDLHLSLNIRMKNIEQSRTMALATVLDPRYKLAVFTEKSAALTVKQHLIALLERNIATSSVESPAMVVASSTPNMEENVSPFSIWQDIHSIIPIQKPKGTSKSAAIAELERYIEESHPPPHEDPLSWWEKNHNKFPNISKLVTTKFGVLATSMACKRIFSKAGTIINNRRTRFSPQHIEHLLFLNSNSYLLDSVD